MVLTYLSCNISVSAPQRLISIHVCWHFWHTWSHHPLSWTWLVLWGGHRGQRWAPDRPTCAGSGWDSGGIHRDLRVESPKWKLCLQSSCNTESLLAIVASTGYHQPRVKKMNEWLELTTYLTPKVISIVLYLQCSPVFSMGPLLLIPYVFL